MPHIKGMIEFDCDFDALAEEMEKSGYVKVVRCKDCKHFETCSWSEHEDDGFCKWGERSEDNADAEGKG